MNWFSPPYRHAVRCRARPRGRGQGRPAPIAARRSRRVSGFCSRCGTPVSASAVSPRQGSAVEARPAIGVTPPRPLTPTSIARGVSIWWLVIPTLIFAFLTRDIVRILILAIIGAGLKYAQTRKEIPSGVRPYLPFLQPVVVFFFLGGNPIVIIGVGAAIVGAVLQHSRLIPALEPWWQIQQRIPPIAQRVLAFALTLVIGYFFGVNGAGREWTVTFLSMVTGTVVAFLLMFTPPVSLRQPGRSISS